MLRAGSFHLLTHGSTHRALLLLAAFLGLSRVPDLVDPCLPHIRWQRVAVPHCLLQNNVCIHNGAAELGIEGHKLLELLHSLIMLLKLCAVYGSRRLHYCNRIHLLVDDMCAAAAADCARRSWCSSTAETRPFAKARTCCMHMLSRASPTQSTATALQGSFR